MRILLLSVLCLACAPAAAQDASGAAEVPFTLERVRDYASCIDLTVVDSAGKPVVLPPDAIEGLQCPMVLDLEGVHLTYMTQWKVIRLDLTTYVRVELFGVFPEAEGIDGPCWSPDRRSMLFRIVDQGKHNGYKESSRLIVVTVENDQVVVKRKFDRFVNFVCGSNCGAIHADDIGFRDDDTIFYRRHWASEERPEEIDEIDL